MRDETLLAHLIEGTDCDLARVQLQVQLERLTEATEHPLAGSAPQVLEDAA